MGLPIADLYPSVERLIGGFHQGRHLAERAAQQVLHGGSRIGVGVSAGQLGRERSMRRIMRIEKMETVASPDWGGK